MFNSLQSPVLIAHRGASAYAPENTLASFILAAEQGAKMIELDVQLTADEELVVIHDKSVDRTTNGTGMINDLTLAEIRLLTVSEADPIDLTAQRIPTLEEVFLQLDKSVLINIELKNIVHPLDTLPKKVAKLVKQHQMEPRVFFSSFNPFALARIGRLVPGSPRGRLLHFPLTVDFHSRFPGLLKGCSSVNVSFQSLSIRRVKRFQAAGLKVFTYTLNKPEDIIKALELGVDGFFTDNPLTGFDSIEKWRIDQ